MKSHWTIAIYGSVAFLNGLAYWAAKDPSLIMVILWLSIMCLCLFRITVEFLDWKT